MGNSFINCNKYIFTINKKKNNFEKLNVPYFIKKQIEEIETQTFLKQLTIINACLNKTQQNNSTIV